MKARKSERMKRLVAKIQWKWMKLHLQPIRVFCFHQVSEQFDLNVNCKSDWMPLAKFKRKISDLQKAGYVFISLQEAHRHLQEDLIRCKKYAVLTCDDGLKCQAELLPWLEEQEIPLTMFVTAKNLDGRTCGPQILDYFKITDREAERKLAEQLYLNREELMKIDSPVLTIGMHGYEHVDSLQMDIELFKVHAKKSVAVLQPHKRFIPFCAYPYGSYTEQTDIVLNTCGVVPVYIDYLKNYNDATCIHRELL